MKHALMYPLHPQGTAVMHLLASSQTPTTLRTHAETLGLDDGDVWLVWELLRLVPDLDPQTRRDLGLLLLLSRAAILLGSMCLPLKNSKDQQSPALFQRLLHTAVKDKTDRERMVHFVDGLATSGIPTVIDMASSEHTSSTHTSSPLLIVGGVLYERWAYRIEKRLARFFGTQRFVEDALKDPDQASTMGKNFQLSEEQSAAVKAAVSQPMTLISGGPGTGKTSIVLAILSVLSSLKHTDEPIALAAPTGKAAHRMSVVAHQGQTLHRLLGYMPHRGFRHDDQNPLPHHFVIVDEASMIDAHMMDALIRALRPEAHLVLLGDADQLPSVEAGAVFRDVCTLGGKATHQLTHSYRMRADNPNGRRVLKVAQRIKIGDAVNAFGCHEDQITLREHLSDLAFQGVEMLHVPSGFSTSAARALLQHLRNKHAAALPNMVPMFGRVYHVSSESWHLLPEESAHLDTLFSWREATRILCVTRAQNTGVHAVNHWFHAQWLTSSTRTPKRTQASKPAFFVPGEPVMVVRNDYKRGLFNGDQGMVLRVALKPSSLRSAQKSANKNAQRSTQLAVVFRRDAHFVAYPLAPLRSLLELAYATTVHKSQGSEYDQVTLILPDEPVPLLTRAMVYTALTRSRHAVVFVGKPAVLEAAIQTSDERVTGLTQLATATRA